MATLLAAGLTAAEMAAHRVEHDGVVLAWNPHRRLALLRTRPGSLLTAAHARAIGHATADWAGSPPSAPYAFVVEGQAVDDALTDRGYRETLGRGARADGEHIRLLFYGGTEQTRRIASLYLRGVETVGAVVETEVEAVAWLAERGFA